MMQQSKLTRAEELVLRGVTYGLTRDEVALALGLSRESVGRQIADAYSKVHRLAQEQSREKRLSNSGCKSLPAIWGP